MSALLNARYRSIPLLITVLVFINLLGNVGPVIVEPFPVCGQPIELGLSAGLRQGLHSNGVGTPSGPAPIKILGQVYDIRRGKLDGRGTHQHHALGTSHVKGVHLTLHPTGTKQVQSGEFRLWELI